MPKTGDGIGGQIAEAERIAFENSAPLSVQQLKDLLSRLDAASRCNHTFTDVRTFAEQHSLDVDRVILWLHEHGAHCDCEVTTQLLGTVCERRSSNSSIKTNIGYSEVHATGAI